MSYFIKGKKYLIGFQNKVRSLLNSFSFPSTI